MKLEFTVRENKNHHYCLEMLDFTVYLDWLSKTKPKREIGIKWSNWVREMEFYNKYYRERPYWIQVEMYGDDDMLVQREFSDKAEAERMHEELATCPEVPDFDKLGFK